MEPPYGDTVGMAAHSASTVYSGEPNCGSYDVGVYGGICRADLDDIVDNIWQGEESREDQYTVQEASEEEHQEGQEYGGGICQRVSNNNSAHPGLVRPLSSAIQSQRRSLITKGVGVVSPGWSTRWQDTFAVQTNKRDDYAPPCSNISMPLAMFVVMTGMKRNTGAQ